MPDDVALAAHDVLVHRLSLRRAFTDTLEERRVVTTILRRIIFPVIAPGVAVTAIFTFVFAFNEYLMALVLTSRNASTVPVTVAKFIQPYSILWGDVGASATIQLLPILVVVFLLQRHIMRGITLGAVK